MEGLTWVKASHNSPYGKIVSSWKRAGDTLTLTVEIPPNTTAEVYVPATGESSVSENGAPVTRSADIKFNGMQGGCAVFGIGSGCYVFTSTVK